MSRILLLLALLCAGLAWSGRTASIGPGLDRASSRTAQATRDTGQEALLSHSAEKLILEVRESLTVDSLVHASKGTGRGRPQGTGRLELDPLHRSLLRGAAMRARGLAAAHREFAASLAAERSGFASFHATGTPPPAPGA